MKRIEMFGLAFQPFRNVVEVAKNVFELKRCDEGRVPLMITPNVDQVVKLERSEHAALKTELSKAQWILPDGGPIVTLSKLKNKSSSLPARLTGSDFFPEIWKLLKAHPSEKVCFILPDANLGKRFVSERKENIKYYAPPFLGLGDDDAFGNVKKEVEQCLAGFDAGYVFIGLGFPKQEYIALHIFEHFSRQGRPLPKVFLLGASFEFYQGVKKRAPKIWQKLGIEFVHRLISEPRRMVKRYLVDDAAFIKIAVRELSRKEKN
ncbi:MAG: WecB/TagA/CpsF family glycosyltransferase [Cryomorphaceae bacterium]